MHCLGGVLTREESDAYVERAERHLSETGFCPWAVEAPGVSPLIGAVGLKRIVFEASFTPAVEVAWRLHRPYWGQGYATEAARAAIDDGFRRVGLQEIVAIDGSAQHRFDPCHGAVGDGSINRVRLSKSLGGEPSAAAHPLPVAAGAIEAGLNV